MSRHERREHVPGGVEPVRDFFVNKILPARAPFQCLQEMNGLCRCSTRPWVEKAGGDFVLVVHSLLLPQTAPGLGPSGLAPDLAV